MQSLEPGWLLLSQRSAAHFELAPDDVVHTFEAAAKRLQRGGVAGLMVDAAFRGMPGGAWSAAFAARERFPTMPVAILRSAPSFGKKR